MSTRQLVCSVALALLLAGVSGTRSTASAGDESDGFERVIYANTSSWDRIALLEIRSPTEAELLLREGTRTRRKGTKSIRGKWSIVAGPLLRFVAPDNEVELFRPPDPNSPSAGEPSFDLENFRGERLHVVVGDDWHHRSIGDQKLRAPPTFYEPDMSNEMFAVHSDGSADWIGEDGVFATPRALAADGTLALTLRDGKRRTFRREGTGWREVGAELFRSVADPDSRSARRKVRLDCQMNLGELLRLYMSDSLEQQGPPPYSGVALFLHWRKIGRIDWDQVLRCPGDPHLRPLDAATQRLYEELDPKSPPNDLCSYAVRDFTRYPLDPDDPKPQIIACCRQGRDGRTPHHKDGINVALDNGACSFFTRDDLGLGPNEPIVVGPESKHPMLRQVVQVPKR